MNTQFKNVTISGLPGSGSTTLLNKLKETLQFEGWKGFSGGEFMREYAKEKGLFQEHEGVHHDSSHYEDDFDRKVDYGMREKLESEDKWILESWLSGFMGQGVPNVLKVLMICSDEAVKIDRVVNRDNISVQEAKDNMHERYQRNLDKWSRMYHNEWDQWVVQRDIMDKEEPINFWDPRLYDLVIDTYSLNKEDSLKMVLDKLGINPDQPISL
jgi:cytidylate kinase